ncbi:hypothetical protein M426DRAFT_324422 [Hypoxylon sp. CI-4A]|nr:hypothetical protein M426DRAFT_324422 [Hypoxylon sp. CI-4A]
MESHDAIPESNSSDLRLAHSTEDECIQIWTNTFASWGDSLELPDYLRESQFLTTIPLAENGGMTTWVLVDKNLEPSKRPILSSSESFYKISLTSDKNGKVEDVVVHGIASVFCAQEYRRRGYAARHMKELAGHLRSWKSERGNIVGSVLYSDIGKVYYTKLGWTPNSTNIHIEFPPLKVSKSTLVQDIAESDLPELCRIDEAMIREAMGIPAPGVNKRLTILPDVDHMLWHIRKEDFATNCLFGKTPPAKGAIAGAPGHQVWAIWTHRYYGRPDAKSHNILYILRLVVEGDESANKPHSKEETGALSDDQVACLEAVLKAACAEAAEWNLDHVKLWEPSPNVQRAIFRGKLQHVVVEREEDSIASGMWYDENGGFAPPPVWINNEHYAWC